MDTIVFGWSKFFCNMIQEDNMIIMNMIRSIHNQYMDIIMIDITIRVTRFEAEPEMLDVLRL